MGPSIRLCRWMEGEDLHVKITATHLDEILSGSGGACRGRTVPVVGEGLLGV